MCTQPLEAVAPDNVATEASILRSDAGQHSSQNNNNNNNNTENESQFIAAFCTTCLSPTLANTCLVEVSPRILLHI